MARGSKNKELTLAQALGQFLERTLIPDLRARVEESPSVKRALDDALARERAAGRTADDPIAYRERMLEQVGAAWLLDCVFVRFLEDRGFVSHRRLAGDGAVDAQERFGAAFPGLAGNAREYLLAVFREAGNLPGARELLGARHDVARRLSPSAGVAGDLLRLFREELPDKRLRWRFDTDDTRPLGDLYQHLSIAVQERYALKQTPDFVESFILDQTLDPAVKEFGLDGFRMIDPTCGSGHFLLGAFHRLRVLHERKDPAGDPKQHAYDALRHVYGVDLNPFAIAISRFRLLVAYLGAAGIRRLRDAPADLNLDRHVVVADSLLYGGKSPSLAERLTDNVARRALGGEHFVLEDPIAGRAVFEQRYHAVVGNPPYILCRDAALRELYRARYPDSAKGKYALAAPFTERFFELGEASGFVGLINSNSFMKREFGKGLVERVLRNLDLTGVIDTSGAFIPNHGTPTVILFGRNQKRKSDTVRAVLGRRGEAETPADPANGNVWSSIVHHLDDASFENDFVTITDLPHATFATHPWSLGGGGAGELKELIDQACPRHLEAMTRAIGFDAIMGEDEIFKGSIGFCERLGLDSANIRTLVEGDVIRDWALATDEAVVFPYDADLSPVLPGNSPLIRHHFWSYRQNLIERRQFGKNTIEAGLQWFEYRSFYKSKRSTILSIAFAAVATHNHFAIDHGGRVFKQSAPVIKLLADATLNDHLALVAWLNSSAACFWLKQVCHLKTNHTEERPERGDADMMYFDFSGTAVGKLPCPSSSSLAGMMKFANAMVSIDEQEAGWKAKAVAERLRTTDAGQAQLINEAERTHDFLRRKRVATQENLDWHAYALLGLCESALGIPIEFPNGIDTEERLFVRSSPPVGISAEGERAWSLRRQALEQSRDLQLIENPANKRRWIGVGRGSFAQQARSYREEVTDAGWSLILGSCERFLNTAVLPMTPAEIYIELARDAEDLRLLNFLVQDQDPIRALTERFEVEAVPFLVPWRFTDTGMEKRGRWEMTWDLQRRMDAGEKVGEISVPPKYDREDYRTPWYFALRGKLDVPRERFIAYPGATTDDDPSPLYGWAGWDHRQRAEALTALYLRRKDEDGWTAERLLPLLAGLDELVPWLKQWHKAPQPGEDLGAGDAYDAFLTTELHALGLTRAQLRGWRPPEKRAGRAAAKAKAAAPVPTDEGAGEAPAPKKRGRPKKAVES